MTISDKDNREHFTQFPNFSIDTIFVENNIQIIELTDSKSFFNPTIYYQTLFWYSHNLIDKDMEYDSMRFQINMPNREGLLPTNSLPYSRIKTINAELLNSYSLFTSVF